MLRDPKESKGDSPVLSQDRHPIRTAVVKTLRAVLGLFQDSLVELEKRQLPIDVELRSLEVYVVHCLV